MSWDIILFNSKEEIVSIEKLDEGELEPIDFTGILVNSFNEVIQDGNHRELKGVDFSISFFANPEKVSNIMLNLEGENGLFELIELSKKYKWQIFDTGLGSMVDLENPNYNGYKNHKKYVEQIMKKINRGTT